MMLAALLLQAPIPAAPPAPPAWTGTLEAGLTEVAALSESGRADDACALADVLAERAAARSDRALLAEVAHARGTALARAERWSEAAAAFGTAVAEAGPGELRLTAAYDRGTALLEGAEMLRQAIPELAAQAAPPKVSVPPVPPVQLGPGGGEDPLALARAAYLEARAALVLRVRAAPRDLDPRANLELAVRRLRELDELERQRQEQQQQDQQGEDQPESQAPQDSEGDAQGGDESQDAEPEGDGSADRAEGEQDETQAEPPSEPQQDPAEQEAEDASAEPQDAPGEAETPEPMDAAEQAGDGQALPGDESVLSREEVLEILDALEELEARGEALRARLRQLRRVPVEKDW